MTSFIFEHSCLATKPELDLFSNLPTQEAVEEHFHTEIQPNTSLDDGSINFTVSDDSNYYLDLATSYLYLEVKITKGDGTAIDADTAVGPVNSLFKLMDVYLNDVLISNASNLYHNKAFLETLLTYNDKAKKSQLTMALFYKDTAGKMDDVNDDNVGLKTKAIFC